MKTGICKFYNSSKGYGFITPDEGGKDVFVHATGLNDEITENDKVQYEEEEGKRGPQAVNVQRID